MRQLAGGYENKHSTDVNYPSPPRVCIRKHTP
jgi:hypothetical protein